MNIHHEYTRKILDAFGQISQVPRPSRKEEQIVAWLLNWASENGLKTRTDEEQNVLIEVPASKGFEHSQTLVLQGHMDMVCEKAKGFSHDFEKDPIELIFTDDGWLTANQTTLGADNGIAIAMAMVAATDKTLGHPPLELLFTTDEETGLTGASSLQPGFVKGRQLLNIDSEDEGVFTVGCAGGEDALLRLPFMADESLPTHSAFRLVGGGMSGGHSGIDIIEERANALKLVFRGINLLCEQSDVRIATFSGGTARNAIPRDAEAVLLIPSTDVEMANAIMAEFETSIRAEYLKTDPNLTMKLKTEDGDYKATSAATTRRATDTVFAYPHGVAAMSKDIEGLVETSNNMATIKTENNTLVILSNQRSSNMDSLKLICDNIMSVARLAGAEGETSGSYPSWKPNMDSELLARCQDVYEKRFGKKPVVEAIHAGLECGIIGSVYEGMDMISFGPTIKNPHSPDEKIEVESIGQVWDFMVALFESYR
ncbi:MAG: aminoacyl-histidine dipeptidase [Gammaproteobacteria bacterium]|nr:aminoacyl-histidine dipeptidase [Gammaproteobacteria bacterium]